MLKGVLEILRTIFVLSGMAAALVAFYLQLKFNFQWMDDRESFDDPIVRRHDPMRALFSSTLSERCRRIRYHLMIVAILFGCLWLLAVAVTLLAQSQ